MFFIIALINKLIIIKNTKKPVTENAILQGSPILKLLIMIMNDHIKSPEIGINAAIYFFLLLIILFKG